MDMQDDKAETPEAELRQDRITCPILNVNFRRLKVPPQWAGGRAGKPCRQVQPLLFEKSCNKTITSVAPRNRHDLPARPGHTASPTEHRPPLIVGAPLGAFKEFYAHYRRILDWT